MGRRFYLIFTIFFIVNLNIFAANPNKYYVKVSGTGLGKSWGDAAGNLQQIINKSESGDTIFVAAGTYNVPSGSDKGFVMKEGVNVYGGFSGEGSVSYRSQINPTNYITYIEGIEGSRILTQESVFQTQTEWGGFTMRNASISGDIIYGGVVYLQQGGKLWKTTIQDNNVTASSTIYGGAIYNNGGDIEYCTVKRTTGKAGTVYGTGIYNRNGRVQNSIVIDNSAEANAFFTNVVTAGGGIYNQSGTVINTVIAKNTAYAYALAAAYSSGGGVYNQAGSIINCTIADNVSQTKADAYTYTAGGGLYNQGVCTVVNTIIWSNKTNSISNNIYDSDFILYSHCLVGNKKASDIGIDKGNLDGTISKLLFTDAYNNNYRLLPYSIAIDAGNDDVNNTESDADGNKRKYHAIDLGAYEYQGDRMDARVVMTTALATGRDISFNLSSKTDASRVVIDFGNGLAEERTVNITDTEVKGVVGTSKIISIYTLSEDSHISKLVLQNDSLTSLSVNDSQITSVDCSRNLFRISTLPDKKAQWSTYIYAPQTDIPIKAAMQPTDTVDLKQDIERNGIATVYTWKRKLGGTLVEGTDYTMVQGVTHFLKAQDDSIYCEMTNTSFPDLILKTTKTKVNKILPVITLDSEQLVYNGLNLYITPASQYNTVKNIPLPLTYRYIREDGWDRSYALNAGEYRVIAYFAGDDVHQAATSNVVTLTVAKATPDLLLTAKNIRYTGSTKIMEKPAVTGSATTDDLSSSLNYKYLGFRGTTYAASENAPKDIGIYKVIVSSSGDVNHESVSKSATMAITNSGIVRTMTDATFTYDGAIKKLTVYAGTVENVAVKYTYEGTMTNNVPYGPSDQAPVNAGVYTVEALVGEDTVPLVANLIIKRREATFEIENKTVAYTGAPVVVNTRVLEPVSALYTQTYKGTGSTVYEESQNAPSAIGTYIVTSTFVGNANYLSAKRKSNLSIVNGAVPTLSLKNKNVVYSGSVQKIDSVKLSEGSLAKLTYTYSNVNYPASATAPTAAGTYLVTASIDTSNNAVAKSVQAILKIEKADQTIELPQSLFNGRQLVDGQFDISATSSSGEPVVFNSGNPNIANVRSNTTVSINTLGTTTIMAKAGESTNYKAAAPVIRTLDITSSDVSIHSLTINGEEHDISERYVVPCGYESDNIDIVIETGADAVLSIERSFQVDVTQPMVKYINFTITSQDGKMTQSYTLVVEKRFTFEEVVNTRLNNTFIASPTAYNYSFSSYKWYMKKTETGTFEEVGTGGSYTATSGSVFNESETYYLELTTSGGEVLRTCEANPVLKKMNMTLYPNPVNTGEECYVSVDIDDDMISEGYIEIYYVTGVFISKIKMTQQLTTLPTTLKPGVYIVRVISKRNFVLKAKLIVR